MDPQTQRAIALTLNGTSTAFVILANCLKNNGALDPEQIEDGLRRTINAEGADRDRLDYQVLQQILARLEGQQPPTLRLIPGGKTDE